MNSSNEKIKDFSILTLSALCFSAPVIVLGFWDLDKGLKDDIFFYYSLAVLFAAFYFVFKKFTEHAKWFGFKSKKPIMVGALLNSFFLIGLIFLLRNQAERTSVPMKAVVSISEMIFWVLVMRWIGNSAEQKRFDPKIKKTRNNKRP